jgi:hypothetical protein
MNYVTAKLWVSTKNLINKARAKTGESLVGFVDRAVKQAVADHYRGRMLDGIPSNLVSPSAGPFRVEGLGDDWIALVDQNDCLHLLRVKDAKKFVEYFEVD